MKPEISAVVCTHNQADYLEKSIASLFSQTLGKERFEIILVDNASQDHTSDIIRDLESRGPFRYFYEPNIGLSFARNRGWKNALSEYVAFLDSDAIACPEWLEKILDRFQSTIPKPAAVGGRIVPIWEEKRPEWLTVELETYVGIIDWSDNPLVIDVENSYYLAGSNVAYQKNILQRVGGFSVNLGRRGQRLLSNEEIFLQKKLISMNMPLFYDPGICVRHHVKSECLRKTWFYKRFFWQGISDVILEYKFSQSAGETWLSIHRLWKDLSQLYRESLLYLRRIWKKSIEKVAIKSRILYWLARILYFGRISIKR